MLPSIHLRASICLLNPTVFTVAVPAVNLDVTFLRWKKDLKTFKIL
jgi:hypothetical protein